MTPDRQLRRPMCQFRTNAKNVFRFKQGTRDSHNMTFTAYLR